MTRTRAPRARTFGDPPANYPVPVEFIPDMPLQTFHLETFGRVGPDECELFGWPVMRCATCSGPVTQFLMRSPLGVEFWRQHHDQRKTIPGLVWGVDVAPICPCCSSPDCRHCLWHGEMVMSHDVDPSGTCRRCERRGLRVAA